MRVGLICLIPFSQFGKEYSKGDVVPDGDYEVWDRREANGAPGTLKRRMQEGFVEWGDIPDEGDALGDDGGVTDAKVALMSKDDLVLYAQNELSSKLDRRLNRDILLQQVQSIRARQAALARRIPGGPRPRVPAAVASTASPSSTPAPAPEAEDVGGSGPTSGSAESGDGGTGGTP